MTAVTINGNAYSDDGSQSRDMRGFGYRDWLLPMLADTMTEAAAVGASVTAAAGSASAAAASATAAQNYAASLSGTSTTSTSIGTGSKSLTTQTGKQFLAGQWVMVVRVADVNAWMFGQIVSYNSGSGALVVNVTAVNGAGAFSDWVIMLSGARGATGANGTGIPAYSAGDAGKLMGVNPAGDGTEWVGLPFSSIQIFTGTGTFTPDPRRNNYFVIAIGGGGGGNDFAGYSGWGGETVMGVMAISSAQTVTIGAGGVGGASPTAGGDTAIGTLLVAKGGPNALTPSPATGGTTPSGCVRVPGARSVGTVVGCTGGTWLHVPTETNSDVTTLPQDGHGGASTASSYTQRNGGAGIVIIIW